MPSALRGILSKLQGEPNIPRQAVVELERLFEILYKHGWSGFIPADEALLSILKDKKK